MKRKNPLPYFIIFCSVLLLVSLPLRYSESIRGAVFAVFAPFFELFSKNSQPSLETENQRLLIENSLLREETNRLQEILRQDILASKFLKQKDVVKKYTHLSTLISHAAPAKVIYRVSSAWNSSLWINVGKADNDAYGHEIIAKNSPVVVGLSLVGVVDYVGKHQSRVRLITDPGLTPSVRISRGKRYNRILAQNIDLFLDVLAEREDLFPKIEEKIDFVASLEKIQKKINKGGQEQFLAKGELCGSCKAAWKSRGTVLSGIGFNYDYADDEGPARDLRTGAPQDGSGLAPTPLIKANDLLVTTGMDGVFPAGIPVATVSKVFPLQEGDYYYEIEAIPTAGDMEELTWVTVIPPLGFDPSDQPK